jgi:hypothetical protein
MAKDPKFEQVADAAYKCRQCGAIYVHKLNDEDLTRGYCINSTSYETMFFASLTEQNTHYQRQGIDPKKIPPIAPNTYLHDCSSGQRGLGDLISLVNIRTIEIHLVGRGTTRKLLEP